uniref:protein POLR1D-like n=1 Tax=Myxine glutinosa TaxID=7769 RepID=UPI00358FE79E
MATNDSQLERLAREEILQEAKRGKIRAESMGPLGWQKSPIPKTNKRFLINTIKGNLQDRVSRKRSSSCQIERKGYSANSSNGDQEQRAELSRQKAECGKNEQKVRAGFEPPSHRRKMEQDGVSKGKKRSDEGRDVSSRKT